MTALPAVTKQQAPPPAEQVPDGRPTVTAETQKMPESRPATAEAPQMPARAEARATTTQGIDLALLEEAGMDILRATGEVDKPIVRRPSAAMPDQLQGATKSPPDALPSSPVARARTDEATGAAVQQHESHGRRHAPSAASANTEAAESADQRRPAQVFRESLRDALPDLVETSRLQSARSTPLAERHTEADPGQSPPSERAATSAPHDVDRPSSVQDAPSGAGRRGAEELRPDVSGAGRTLQHEMPRALGAARPESRAPELARTLVDQVVKALQLEIKGPVSEMRLHLEPESLGELALRVRVDEGKLQARIEVTQPAVKAIIEGNLPQLRQSLAAQGIQMDRIDIATQDRSLSRGNSEGSGGRERRRGSKPDESLVEPAVQAARMLGYNTIELTM
jgi:hypothetical protein